MNDLNIGIILGIFCALSFILWQQLRRWQPTVFDVEITLPEMVKITVTLSHKNTREENDYLIRQAIENFRSKIDSDMGASGGSPSGEAAPA